VELAAQAAAGIAKINPTVLGVVEMFKDVIADPAKDGANLVGHLPAYRS
jgi:amidase/6-aminohexanoate-cyclic-dimer hydrolase